MDYTGKIGIGNTQSTAGSSNLEGRCPDCKAIFGHFAGCPTLKADTNEQCVSHKFSEVN